MDTKVNDFSSIEKKLDSILRPLNPEESYAANLKQRLLSDPRITVEKQDYLFVIFIIGSLFFIGILLVWFLNRLMNNKT